MPSSSLFLAAAGAVSEEWQLNLTAFIAMVCGILFIWDRLRAKEKNPPDHEIYATKIAMNDMEERIMNSVSATEERLTTSLDSATTERNLKFGEIVTKTDAITASLQSGFQEIFFKLGVVEGQADLPASRAPRLRARKK